MGRILAIDYGLKRTGLAVTDPLQIIATALTTVETSKVMDFIVQYVRTEGVEKVIVGYPTNLHGDPTHATAAVNGFITQLSQRLPDIPLIRWDEAFTSKAAMRTLVDSGVKKKDRRNKALIDSVAATIILQEYLQHH